MSDATVGDVGRWHSGACTCCPGCMPQGVSSDAPVGDRFWLTLAYTAAIGSVRVLIPAKSWEVLAGRAPAGLLRFGPPNSDDAIAEGCCRDANGLVKGICTQRRKRHLMPVAPLQLNSSM